MVKDECIVVMNALLDTDYATYHNQYRILTSLTFTQATQTFIDTVLARYSATISVLTAQIDVI